MTQRKQPRRSPDMTVYLVTAEVDGSEAVSIVPQPSPPAVSDRRVQRVLELAQGDPHLSVDSLARAVDLSPSRLEHLFKGQTGQCLRGHLVRVRLRRAEHLLRTTGLSVKEIAATLGYAQTPSFIRVFTATHGQPPRTYRLLA